MFLARAIPVQGIFSARPFRGFNFGKTHTVLYGCGLTNPQPARAGTRRRSKTEDPTVLDRLAIIARCVGDRHRRTSVGSESAGFFLPGEKTGGALWEKKNGN